MNITAIHKLSPMKDNDLQHKISILSSCLMKLRCKKNFFFFFWWLGIFFNFNYKKLCACILELLPYLASLLNTYLRCTGRVSKSPQKVGCKARNWTEIVREKYWFEDQYTYFDYVEKLIHFLNYLHHHKYLSNIR